jgi:hypothetical protein
MTERVREVAEPELDVAGATLCVASVGLRSRVDARNIKSRVANIKSRDANIKLQDANIKSRDANVKLQDANIKARVANIRARYRDSGICDLDTNAAFPDIAKTVLQPRESCREQQGTRLQYLGLVPR